MCPVRLGGSPRASGPGLWPGPRCQARRARQEAPRARVGPEDAFCGAVFAERLERIFGCPCGWRGRPGQCAASFRPGGCSLSRRVSFTDRFTDMVSDLPFRLVFGRGSRTLRVVGSSRRRRPARADRRRSVLGGKVAVLPCQPDQGCPGVGPRPCADQALGRDRNSIRLATKSSGCVHWGRCRAPSYVTRWACGSASASLSTVFRSQGKLWSPWVRRIGPL